jgi:hypothetical protein
VKEETVFTIHIGETDIYEWTQGIGKSILMPILLEVCKEVIEENIEERIAARVQFSLKGKPKIYDFVVKLDGVDGTLSKIIDWAISEEEYEICSEIKKLQEKLQNEDFSYRR